MLRFDERRLVVKRVGDAQTAVASERGDARATVGHHHGHVEPDLPRRSILILDADIVQRLVVRQRAAVEPGKLRAPEADLGVLNAHGAERRHQVLDRVHLGLAVDDRRTARPAAEILQTSLDARAAGKIGAHEDDAAVRRRRDDLHLDIRPGVEPHPSDSCTAFDSSLPRHTDKALSRTGPRLLPTLRKAGKRSSRTPVQGRLYLSFRRSATFCVMSNSGFA